MLKNNNMAAVKKLGVRFLRQNRIRNLFAILAIVLTTFMFTTVFGIGFSLAKNVNVMQLRMQGTKTTVILRQPDRQQIRQAQKAKNLSAAGIQVLAGAGSGDKGQIHILLDYYDDTEFEKNLKPAIADMEGYYPEKENEIMLPRAALAALGIREPESGAKLALTTEDGKNTFVLSGWFTDFSSASGSYEGLVSWEYAEAHGRTVEKDGILCLSARPGRQAGLLEELETLVALREGQRFESVYDVQGENRSNALTIAPVIGVISLLVILSGYLLIYNIMYISVTKDIRFYGMLKTIGTSPSQIKILVKMQAVRLSLLGIPLGLLLGSALSFVIIPMAHRFFQVGQDGAMPDDLYFHPLVYVGTVVFAIITVNISCHKPAKLAGRISAVEAMKYNGLGNDRIKARKSTDGGKLYKMAFRNVFREKKRAFLVFASLFMGTVVFLSVNTYIGSMELENYIKYYLPNDFVIFIDSGTEGDTAAGNGEGAGEQTGRQTEADRAQKLRYANQLAEDVKDIDGVAMVWTNRCINAMLEFDETVYKPFLERDYTDEKSREEAVAFYQEHAGDRESAYQTQVIAVGSQMLKTYQEKTGRDIDIDRF